jgi:putative tryptophan/tyrosine transport system substrate-binding protein
MLTLGVLATSPQAGAQPAGKARRIGYLSGSSAIGPREEAFRQGLRELAHVEGQNIVIEWRFAEGREDRLAALALELVRSKVDVNSPRSSSSSST